MLSYRHAFHAGNHADVLKHASLSLLLASFRQKDKPFIVIDTHAGGGIYDLEAERAQKNSEFKKGIARLWPERAQWPELADYFQAIAAHNVDDTLRFYPGSPDIAAQLTRPQDRLALMELHNREIDDIRAHLGWDKRVALHHRDGLEGLVALVPPTPRRGLVLIDPPYERHEEYREVPQAVQKAWQRWPTGTYVIWYPLLAIGRDGSAVMLQQMKRAHYGNLLIAEIEVDSQHPEFGMHGSGLAIINPPWQLDKQLESILPRLSKVLQAGARPSWKVEWLTRAD